LVLDGDESSGFVFKSPSYHHQGFPQNCQLEFEWCRISYTPEPGPISLQIVGQRGGDARLCAIASLLTREPKDARLCTKSGGNQ